MCGKLCSRLLGMETDVLIRRPVVSDMSTTGHSILRGQAGMQSSDYAEEETACMCAMHVSILSMPICTRILSLYLINQECTKWFQYSTN